MPRRKHGPAPPTAAPAADRQPQQGVGPAVVHAGQEVPAEAGLPRRRFVRRLWALACGAGLLELAWVTASFLRPRQLEGSAEDMFVAGPVDRFEPGSVTAFPGGRFYLVRMKEGGFLALHRECTHLGCTVPWDAAQGRFSCPCHASAFDLTGVVLSPPAPRPLDFYAVRIENAVVKVDTRRRLQRTAFDPSQVTVA